MHHAVAQMGGDFDDYTRILMHEMLIDTYQQPNPNAHQETTHPPKPAKTELPQTDLFTQALIQDAVNLYGGTFESNLQSEIIGQLAMAQQANTQATAQPASTASPPMSFIDYVKAVNDSAFIAHFNRQMASIVHMSVGDFWNGMQASSQAIVAPDTSIWGRAGRTTLLALDAATVLPLVGPAARAGSVAIRGATSAVKSSYAASAMLLNEASTLRAADMALTSAAAASQPKAGFQVALRLIDAPTATTSLSNAGLMKSVGLFGRVVNAAENNPAINRTMHEGYKAELRQSMEKPIAQNANLRRLVDDLYKPNAKVGSGSTADAIRKELVSGNQVGGKYHSEKGEQYRRALEGWMQKNPTASSGDRAIAENLFQDLNNAMRYETQWYPRPKF
jgi:hypothetical protein